MVMRITKNFTLKELIHSNTAVARGISNTPSEEIIENLISLTNNIIQPLRDMYGRQLFVTSGYRSPELNKAVGGVPTSQHLKGEASDLSTGGRREARLLFRILIGSNLDFDQAILYDDGRNNFVHVSYTTERKNRKQILYSKGTKPL